MVDGKLKFNPYHELYTYESYFTGLRLAVGAHPSYIAMYALLALLISIDNIFEKQKQSWLIFWVIASIAFIVFIVLLSSRSGVIAAIITLPLFILYRLRGSIQTWLLLGILVVSISGVSIMALNNARVKTSLKDVSENKINEVLNEDIRVTIWKSAWEVIKVNPVMGVGTGNASTELKKEFLKKGYTEGLYDSLNAHNQFLEIQLENGIIGLVIFLLLLGYGLYIAVSENNYFLLAYIIMTIIFFIFESMLNRLAGVMFFPFFMFLLINYEDPGKKDEVKIQRGA
jgi:O-antigen ligase